MLFNDRVLFVHIPKTAGTSLDRYLCEVLPTPLYRVHHDGGVDIPGREGLVHIPGDGHATLEQARTLLGLTYPGLDPRDLPMILAVVRDPYDRFVSRFAWHQQMGGSDPLTAAAARGFDAFMRAHAKVPAGARGSQESYLRLDGAIPSNLRLLRFERLEEDLAAALADLGITASLPLPRLNATVHGDARDFFRPETEAIAHRIERWAFAAGPYPRLDPLPDDGAPAPVSANPLPLSGPVVEERAAIGLAPDRWATGPLEFRLRATAPISALVIRGRVPEGAGSAVPAIAVVNGEIHGIVLRDDMDVRWILPTACGEGGTLDVTMLVGAAVIPAERGGEDVRTLRLHVEGIEALTARTGWRSGAADGMA